MQIQMQTQMQIPTKCECECSCKSNANANQKCRGNAGQSVCERSWKLKCRVNADAFSNANATQGATTVVRISLSLSYMTYPTNPMKSTSGKGRGRSKGNGQRHKQRHMQAHSTWLLLCNARIWVRIWGVQRTS